MRIILFSLLFLPSCTTRHPKPIDSSLISEGEVKDFIIAYDKAWEGRDTTKMKEMMSEQYIYFSSTGNTTTRDKIMGWFTPADKYKMDTAYRNEIRISIHGNTAIVSTHWVGSGVFGTERFDDDQRCGLVIQKINGEIRIISEHCVQIVKN